MNFSKWIVTLALCGAVTGLTRASRADGILYQTGFESPDFMAGQPLNGQNNWMEYNSSGASIITTNQPASGQQSLQINGGALTFLTQYGFYDAFDSPNPTWNFSQYPTVRLDAQVRLDGPSTGSTLADDLISANLGIDNNDNDLAEMWISSNGHVHYYSDADPGSTDDGYLGPAVTLGQYHDLSVLLNTGTLTDSFYVDGRYIASLAMPATAISDDSFYFGVSMVGVADQGNYDHNAYTAYYDNVNLASVPEPGSMAMLLAASLIGVRALKRQRSRRGKPADTQNLIPD
jgi:hypothetical protein